MIKRLALLFIVWEAIIWVASANEKILYGWQPRVEASNEAASATTTRRAAFPPVERESRRSAENALNTRKNARLQTDDSDYDLLTIRLATPPVERESRRAEYGLNTRKKVRLETDESDDDLLILRLATRGAYPSYPSSLGQSSRPGVISVLTEKPIHLANNHEPYNFKSHYHSLFPSSTTRRDFFSSFDKTRKTDASASTEHYIPSPTNPPENLSESFNLGRKSQLQSDAPLTRGPLGNSGTREQDGGRGTKRKIWSSWGDSLSLKTGVTSDENEAQHRYVTTDFLSGFPSAHLDRLSAEENRIATPQFNKQEIQQIIRPFQLGSNTPSDQNLGASRVPALSSGGRIPRQMSPMAGQNDGNVLLSLKPPVQGENGKSWGALQGTKSFPMSRPQHSLRAEKNILLDLPRSTELSLNRSPRPHRNIFQSVIQGSSSENPENIPHVPTMPKTHQPETINTVRKSSSRNHIIKNRGRMKFNTDLFMGEGPNQSQRSYIVKLLNSIPRPNKGNPSLMDFQLNMVCDSMRKKHPELNGLSRRPQMEEIEIFMSNIENWYQYWEAHAEMDVKSVNREAATLKHQFVFPLYLLYVEMIISIIPFKQGLPMGGELNYPQEIRNAIESYVKFNTLMANPPKNEDPKTWEKKQKFFKSASYNFTIEPAGLLWYYIEFWMEYHYTDVWNLVKEDKRFHVTNDFKAFFNTIFTHGIATLNTKVKSLCSS